MVHRQAGAALAFIGGALSLIATSAFAQFPDKPVRIVVGFGAGGPTDIVARIVAPGMSKVLGQQVLVENKPGASGIIATEFVIKSPPDGYTILIGSESDFAVAPFLFKKLPYDTVKDLAPVVGVASLFNVLVVNPATGIGSLKEFVERAKAAPGKVVYGSGGNGTPSHLFGALFSLAAGVELLHIPYKGAGPALADLMGGHVQAMFIGGPAGMSGVKSGKLRALAVTGGSRATQLPDVPTFTEGGTKSAELEGSFWWSLMGPAGLDANASAKIAGSVTAALRTPEIQAQFANQGLSPRYEDAQAIRRLLDADRIKWAKVIKAANISSE